MAKTRVGCGARAGRASRVLATVFASAGATLLITAPGAVATGVSATFAQAVDGNHGSLGSMDGGTLPSERCWVTLVLWWMAHACGVIGTAM